MELAQYIEHTLLKIDATKICGGIIILEHVIELDLTNYTVLKQKKELHE